MVEYFSQQSSYEYEAFTLLVWTQTDLRHPLRLIHSVTLSTAALMIHDGFEEARRTGKALISAGQKGLNYSAAERDKDTY